MATGRCVSRRSISRSGRSEDVRLGLTGHFVPFGCREGGGVHVHHASWSKSVEFLGGEVEVPVFVVGQKSETVELAVCCDELGDEVGVRGVVDRGGRLREDGESQARSQ